MRVKTARRFLKRKSWLIAKLNAGIISTCPSMQKRIKAATQTVVKAQV